MIHRRADSVLEELEQMIVVGDFSNGERLDEMKLAEQFRVSRTPLREAFQRLAASGLVELVPRRGAFVRQPGLVEQVEMFEVMAELEAMCGRLASRRISENALQRIRQSALACEQALARRDVDEYYRHNETFHHLIYNASGNGFLEAEALRLNRRLKPFRRMQLKVRGRMNQSMREHHKILAAIEAGEPEQAAETLRAHVAIQGEKFNDLLASYRWQATVGEARPATGDRGV